MKIFTYIKIIVKLKTLQIQIEKYTYRPLNQTITNSHTFKERRKTQKEIIKQEERLFREEDIRRMFNLLERNNFKENSICEYVLG